jgi:hypothetical protein
LEFVASNGLRDGFDGLMLAAFGERFLVFQFDEEPGAIIIIRKDLAFVTDEQAPTDREVIQKVGNLGRQFRVRLETPVVPSERQRDQTAGNVSVFLMGRS